MKNLLKKVIFTISLFCFIGCTNEDSTNSFLLEGRIVDSVTNEAVSDIEIDFETCDFKGSVMFNTCVTISEGKVLSDSNGRFTILIKYLNEDNNFEFFLRSFNEDYTVDNTQFRYKINSLKELSNFEMKAVKL